MPLPHTYGRHGERSGTFVGTDRSQLVSAKERRKTPIRASAIPRANSSHLSCQEIIRETGSPPRTRLWRASVSKARPTAVEIDPTTKKAVTQLNYGDRRPNPCVGIDPPLGRRVDHRHRVHHSDLRPAYMPFSSPRKAARTTSTACTTHIRAAYTYLSAGGNSPAPRNHVPVRSPKSPRLVLGRGVGMPRYEIGPGSCIAVRRGRGNSGPELMALQCGEAAGRLREPHRAHGVAAGEAPGDGEAAGDGEVLAVGSGLAVSAGVGPPPP